MFVKFNKKNIKNIAKKNCIIPSIALSVALTLSGCEEGLGYSNNNVVDMNYGFDECLILGDDTAIIMDVAEWSDYDGEQLQFITDDNMVVLTSSFDTNAFIGKNATMPIKEIAENAVSENGEVHDLSKDDGVSLYNKDFFDTNWSFNKAAIFNGNNALILNVKKWRDYEGEQLKVETEEGLILNLCSYNSKLIYDVNSETKAHDFAEYYVGEDGVVTDLSNDKSTIYNYELVDFNDVFNKAIVMHNGSTLILPIESWCDYEGEQLQIKIPNGPVFLTDSYHTILVNDLDSTLKAESIAKNLSKTGNMDGFLVGYEADNKYYNRTIIDLQAGFKSGILSGDDFASTIDIKKWLDYEGEQLQVELESGDMLLTSSMMLNMLNGGSDIINTSTIASNFGTGKVIDNLKDSKASTPYNKAFIDAGIKFKYALKVVDGNVTVIPLKSWRDFDNNDGKNDKKKSPFKESPYSYKDPYDDIKKAYDIFSDEDDKEKEDDDKEKEEDASPNCEQLELTLPDGTTLVTTAYDTVLVNNKTDIMELAELFRGRNGTITDLTQYVGEPSNFGWNYQTWSKNKFTHAILTNGSTAQVMPIMTWLDFREGEQLQIKFNASSGLLTSYVNTTLVDPRTDGIENIIASAFQGTLNKGTEAKVYTLK